MNKVEDITILITKGTTPTTTGDGFTESGVNFVKVESIDSNGNVIPELLQKISENTHKKLKRSQLKEDDLLITIAGALGRTYIVRKEILPANTNQAVGIIRVDQKKYSPHFLRYWIQTTWIQKKLGLANAQSIQNNLNLVNLGDIEIPQVPLPTQLKIADLLSLFNNRIELNNKINAELEQMAKTLYDYWFVQFDFPDTNGKPYKSSGGAMVYNEALKRDIPKSWDVKTLSDIEKNIVTGKTPSTSHSEYFDGVVPFITIDDIRKSLFVVKTEKTLSNQGADTQKNKYIPAGSICVTCIATPGLVGFASIESQTNQQINSVVINNEENKYYLYFAIKSYFDFSSGAKSGNTFANMNKGDFESIKFLNPEKGIKHEFHKLVSGAFLQIHSNQKENQKLAELRDWLLPMLMNGQVTVK